MMPMPIIVPMGGIGGGGMGGGGMGDKAFVAFLTIMGFLLGCLVGIVVSLFMNISAFNPAPMLCVGGIGAIGGFRLALGSTTWWKDMTEKEKIDRKNKEDQLRTYHPKYNAYKKGNKFYVEEVMEIPSEKWNEILEWIKKN